MPIGKTDIGGLMKNVVVDLMPLQTVAVDFVAHDFGASLLHYHMQLHMDFGFWRLIKYAGQRNGDAGTLLNGMLVGAAVLEDHPQRSICVTCSG